ncbi:YHYH protein [Calycomorphotria hydatis]|uniref:YHYH domain-containing protein n=1 Tax=Calycomorphotria hydatis TaxID=2528027 RepID=A0A517TAU8_9PLAN|nr:YHYH protein [Calycomorphotria hydatis]QDT65495.1 hypothetical protein V22_27490 [Calycomorphotria hydatis]
MKNKLVLYYIPTIFIVLLATVTIAQQSMVRERTDREYRYIEANGIADHETGRFPNRGNPNRISAQNYKFRMTLDPQVGPPRSSAGYLFGVALNGVPFDPGTAERWTPDGLSGPAVGRQGGGQRGGGFGPPGGGRGFGPPGGGRGFGPPGGGPSGGGPPGGGPPEEGDNVWNFEAIGGSLELGLDQNNAHVQPTGAYHYHGLPNGLIVRHGGHEHRTPAKMVLVGFAADGFPVYATWGYEDPDDANSKLVSLESSYLLKKGNRPSGKQGPGGRYDGTYTQDYEYLAGVGDLDDCNGRVGVTPEFPEGTYYYVLTNDFPFIPRKFRGQPDESFSKHGMHGPPQGFGGGGQGQRGGRPGF